MRADFKVPPPAMRGRQYEPTIGLTEGDHCYRQNGNATVCMGVIEYMRDGPCTCFATPMPPCGACEGTLPECPACGWREQE